MKRVGQIIEVFSNISGHLAGWVLIGVMSLTIIEVISRYVLRHPLILADEFGGYSLLFISAVGLAYCWREHGHIRITFVVERLSSKTADRLRIITLFISLFYVVVVTKVSYDLVIGTFQRHLKSNSQWLTPLAWPQMAIPIGFTFLSIVLLMDTALAVKNIMKPIDRKLTEGKESVT